ncbi:hypothetical protein RSAG8_02714, partial [Rhizoctonia solani AG-8 WAC10335]
MFRVLGRSLLYGHFGVLTHDHSCLNVPTHYRRDYCMVCSANDTTRTCSARNNSEFAGLVIGTWIDIWVYDPISYHCDGDKNRTNQCTTPTKASDVF